MNEDGGLIGFGILWWLSGSLVVAILIYALFFRS